MSIYITPADLQARYSDLDQFSAEALAAAVSDANGLVDSYIPGTYPRPLPMVPDALKGAACDIARLRLYQSEAPDFMQKRHDNALRYLADIASERATLPGALAGTPAETLIFYGSTPPLLSRASLNCW